MQLESLPSTTIIEIFAKSSLAFLQTLQGELEKHASCNPNRQLSEQEICLPDDLAIQAWENDGGALTDGPHFR